MGEDENWAEVNVQLVECGNYRQSGLYFNAKVISAWEGLDGGRYLRISHELTGGYAIRQISLKDHFVTQIRYRGSECPETMEEPYTASDVDQETAFDALKSIFEEEKEMGTSLESGKESNPVVSLQEPKRLELTLQEIGRPEVKKTLLVTDVYPPEGHWAAFSVSGRVWEVHHKKLGKHPATFWSTCHHLVRIEAYLGGGAGSSRSSFIISEGVGAWQELDRMFKKLSQTEVKAVVDWLPEEEDPPQAGDDDYDDDHLVSTAHLGAYSGQAHHRAQYANPAGHARHWTNPALPTYGTMKAYYRVSGDEVGAVLAHEQEGTWEKENPGKTPEQSLQEMLEAGKGEKKAEAGASADNPTGTHSPGPDIHTFKGRCPDCNSLSCLPGRCLEEYDLATYAGLLTSGDGRIIH